MPAPREWEGPQEIGEAEALAAALVEASQDFPLKTVQDGLLFAVRKAWRAGASHGYRQALKECECDG